LLIQKATTLSRAGDYELAIKVAQQAGPHLDAVREPRQPFLQRFTLANCLCHLDRYEEAEPLVGKAEGLVKELGNELDEVRTHWLRGKVCLGLGERERAMELLSGVREHFRREEIAYDYSLATLELTTIHLEEGRTGLVKAMAAEMVWIFDSQQVHEGALAALTLFCQAAQKEEAEAAWARELVKYLYRAQHRPELRFEA
jgi:tetratricopeptide (TPR) repeat protein